MECKRQAGKPLVSSKGMEGKCRSDKLTFNQATKELVPSAIKASTRSLRGQRVGKGSTDEARQVCRSVGGERRSDKPTPNLMVKERVLALRHTQDNKKLRRHQTRRSAAHSVQWNRVSSGEGWSYQGRGNHQILKLATLQIAGPRTGFAGGSYGRWRQSSINQAGQRRRRLVSLPSWSCCLANINGDQGK